MKIQTINGTGYLNGKQITITSNQGAATAQISEGNSYAIVSKIEGTAEKNIQFQSYAGALDYSIVEDLSIFVDSKFEALQKVINTEI